MIEIPNKKYKVIYADCPWKFATYSHKGKGRSAEAFYDCMSLDDIKKLPVSDWATPDCVLLLWATDPLLPQALEVIQAWSFVYKTVGFYWAKLNKSVSELSSDKDFFTGMGYWTRSNVEQCLLATRGHPVRKSRSVRKLIVSPRREHSRKPDEVYGRIEALFDGPYLELFARQRQLGWNSWGTEVETGPGQRRWSSTSYPDLVTVTNGKS
jgi:N6-adenosine-specific RNA methylase IME4